MAFADRHRIDANEQREARGAHTSYGQTPLTHSPNFDPPSKPCGWVRAVRIDNCVHEQQQLHEFFQDLYMNDYDNYQDVWDDYITTEQALRQDGFWLLD